MKSNLEKFSFSDDLQNISIPADSCMVDIQQKILDQNELYEAYKKILPSYFGGNWNAFWDSLAALEEVSERNVLIRHMVLPMLSDQELKTYLEILIDTVDHWEKFDKHKVIIYFLLKDKEKIKNTLD